MLSYLPCSGIVKRVDEHKGEGASATAGEDVLGELLVLRGILRRLEQTLDGVLEGEVQGLRGEVSQHIGQVT